MFNTSANLEFRNEKKQNKNKSGGNHKCISSGLGHINSHNQGLLKGTVLVALMREPLLGSQAPAFFLPTRFVLLRAEQILSNDVTLAVWYVIIIFFSVT